MDHGNKRLINAEKLTAMIHKINPCILRIIIHKQNIITVVALGNKGSRTLYIRVNDLKRNIEPRLTRLIGYL